MKILVVSNLFPPIVFGGYELLCCEVVRELRRRGHHVQILTSNFRAEETGPQEGVYRTLQLSTNFPRPGESVGKVDFSPGRLHEVGRFNARRFSEVAGEFQPDLVFCWCLNRLGAGVVRTALKDGHRVSYTINDEHPRQFRYTSRIQGLKDLLKNLRERFYSESTFQGLPPFKMTVISHALKGKLLQLDAPVERAQVIHQGVSLRAFPYAPSERGEGPFRVLYVGQLSRVKGVHTILKALSLVTRPVELTVVGAGVPDYVRELKRLVAERGLEGCVTFCGKVPREQVLEAYHRHHVLVFSSEWEEPFGLTHLEAMASGCAVVSTLTGGSAELIRDGQNALAYRAGCERELARCLVRLEGDEELRQGLLEGGRSYVEQHHCFEKYVSELEAWMAA